MLFLKQSELLQMLFTSATLQPASKQCSLVLHFYITDLKVVLFVKKDLLATTFYFVIFQPANECQKLLRRGFLVF